MLLKTIVTLSLCLSGGFCENITIADGKTYPFAEKNAIDEIQNHIEENKEKLTKKIEAIKSEQKQKSKEWKPEQKKLSSAKRNKIFYPDMTYTLKDDIRDGNGKIIYNKGFKFNPADYVMLHQELIIIDTNNKSEVKWATQYFDNPKYMILLADGNAFDFTKKIKRPVYYLSKDITNRFQIAATPSIIKQIQNQIQVSEICLKNCQ